VPGLVSLASRGDEIHVDAIGLARDTIVRIASMTKPVIAVAPGPRLSARLPVASCGTLARTEHRRDIMTLAADHDVPIPYMQRTRDYYLALGYGNPYRWAHHVDVPFTPLAKPLAASRVALITTAAPYRPELGDQGPRAKYNASAKFYTVYSDSTDSVPDLRISHVGYDRTNYAADDPSTWFPLRQLQLAVKTGRIGALAPRFHGAPTNRSQRVTIETDAPEILSRCREDGADVALLVPS
jgi:hypothetical protein